MPKNYLLIYAEQLATDIELLCQNIKAPSNTLFQIRKSSSSVYANIREANYGQSRADMLSKFEIALKECSETEGWLQLLFNTKDIDEDTYKKNRNLCGRIRRMLIASCKTLKENHNICTVNKKLQGFDKMQSNIEFWNALDDLVSHSEIVIDRPKGTAHPRYPDFIYRVDYGYLKNTSSMDGDGIDVWVGSGEKKVDAIICIVDLIKKDSEIKILIGCTDEEKRIVFETHNDKPFMKGILIQR